MSDAINVLSVRARVTGWELRPVVFADDGENLTQIPIGPRIISTSEWEAFKDGGDVLAIEAVRQQIEGSNPIVAAVVEPDASE